MPERVRRQAGDSSLPAACAGYCSDSRRPRCSSLVNPLRCGNNHSAAVAARCSSLRSGHPAPVSSFWRSHSLRVRRLTASAFHGRHFMPRRAIPSSITSPAASPAGVTVCSLIVRAPTRRMRRHTTLPVMSSQKSSSFKVIDDAQCASISSRVSGDARKILASRPAPSTSPTARNS